jgi:hypothetical protein
MPLSLGWYLLERFHSYHFVLALYKSCASEIPTFNHPHNTR